jgi:hypothetical protein
LLSWALAQKDVAMSIVEKAKKHPEIKYLLHEMQEKVKLKFQRSQVKTWGSKMESGIAYIYYQECSNPAASMAHELLHIDTQLRGYRRIRIGGSSYDQTSQFQRFMECMDNELQHHKFYKKYLNMGFPPDALYCENPVDLVTYLEESTKKDAQKLIEIIPDFFTLIAPGGSLAPDVKETFLKRIMLMNHGTYQSQLKEIESLIVAWGESNSYDNLPVIRDIMLVLQPKPNYTWFGFAASDRPPNQGFFVDEAFEVEIG